MGSRRWVVALTGAAAAGAALAWVAPALLAQRAREATAHAPARPAPSRPPTPTGLYCQFYVFVESRPFVAFMLEAIPGAPGAYRQLYVAKADGDRTDYNALAGRTPEWRSSTADPQRIVSTATVPDPGPAGLAEQDIAIEIPAFDPARPDKGWREASLKSGYYQNLPGKCRAAVSGGGSGDPPS